MFVTQIHVGHKISSLTILVSSTIDVLKSMDTLKWSHTFERKNGYENIQNHLLHPIESLLVGHWMCKDAHFHFGCPY